MLSIISSPICPISIFLADFHFYKLEIPIRSSQANWHVPFLSANWPDLLSFPFGLSNSYSSWMQMHTHVELPWPHSLLWIEIKSVHRAVRQTQNNGWAFKSPALFFLFDRELALLAPPLSSCQLVVSRDISGSLITCCCCLHYIGVKQRQQCFQSVSVFNCIVWVSFLPLPRDVCLVFQP